MALSSTNLFISLSNYLKLYSIEFSYFLSKSLNWGLLALLKPESCSFPYFAALLLVKGLTSGPVF